MAHCPQARNGHHDHRALSPHRRTSQRRVQNAHLSQSRARGTDLSCQRITRTGPIAGIRELCTAQNYSVGRSMGRRISGSPSRTSPFQLNPADA